MPRRPKKHLVLGSPRIDRNADMIRVAYFMAKYTKDGKPPPEMRAKTFREVSDRLRPLIGEGREQAGFRKSMDKEREHQLSILAAEDKASDETLAVIGPLLDQPRERVWATISHLFE